MADFDYGSMLSALTEFNDDAGKFQPSKFMPTGKEGESMKSPSSFLQGLLGGGGAPAAGVGEAAGAAGAAEGLGAGAAGAGAAEGAAGAAGAAGAMGGIEALLPFLAALCDVRCKENIHLTGETIMGVPEYEFSYIGDKSGARYRGPMAQDLEKIHPELVVEIHGFKMIPAELRKSV